MHSHSFKNNKSLGNTQQLKRVVNASRNLALMSIQCKEEKNPKHEKEMSNHYDAHVLVDSVLDKSQHGMGTVVALMHTCKRELSPAHLVCPWRHNV